ncbi:response regulator [Methylobacterium symbioticum]|uniref:Transcriptional regulatory protein DegU n=1 Tax=Methylobacterium symbioticum TaxID=2584084 RepID=A0A509E7E3_9HYPH|nr:response regulator transcription factor [Methylobacterium symbioticum]VUD70137.1 Transcriptional regulatory protein DegU [Methylobacterium symbioticum]
MSATVDTSLKLLIADNHPMCLRGVRAIVATVAGYEIVEEASSGPEALRLIRAVRPDIALLDIAMPGMHGLSILRQIQALSPETRVIIFSGYEDSNFVRETVSAGVRGYVLKRSAPECLIQALDAVRSGGLYLDPAVAAQIVTGAAGPANRISLRGPRGPISLTEREREVFRLVALGFTNKEVAGKLGVTAKSIETYKSRASEKLDIRSRAKIVQYAMLQGWFNGPPS